MTGARIYTLPAIRERDTVYLEGEWGVQDEFARGSKGSKIHMQYSGREVFMVGSGEAVVRVTRHSESRDVRVTQHTLYDLVETDVSGTHDLTLEVIDGTLDIYTFTFG